MSLQVSLKLKLTKQIKTIKIKYNTFEKATFDEFLTASLALRAKSDDNAFQYIDEITGAGSLNAHFKNLYSQAKEFNEGQLSNIMKNSLYPILKVDTTNRYDYYPELNISIYNGTIYDGDFGTYEDLMEKIYMHEKVIEYNVDLTKVHDKPEPYSVLFDDKKISVKLANKWIDLPEEIFTELFTNELDKITLYKGTIHQGVDGLGWNTLTNSTINNMYANKNFFYDEGGNHCQIRNDNIRKTIVSEIHGFYIYREEIIRYEESAEMSKKTLATLFENKSINEFKTKSLIVILGMCDDLEAQECLNYILERKESKELSQFGIMLLMQGLEKKWSPEVLKSFMKYAEKEQISYIYKANPRIKYSLDELIQVNPKFLSKTDKKVVDEYMKDVNAKRETIKSIIGEVTSSALRENVKQLKSSKETKQFTKLANDLIGHNKVNIDDADKSELEKMLKKCLELKDLSVKLQKELDLLNK